MSKPTTLEKQIRRFYDLCAARENYRAVPWVLEKEEVAMLCRYSVRMMSGHDFKLTPEQEKQADILSHGLNCEYIRITPQHELQGLAWLWSQYDKGWLSPLDIRVMKKFDHFTLAGVATERAGSGWQYVSTPRYRVHSKEYGTFEYEGWSWQSGRKPKVTAGGYRYD